MTSQWWERTEGRDLAQGDLLPRCQMPVFRGASVDSGEIQEEFIETATLIVLTQSCDLENNKVPNVAMCPIYTLPEFEAVNPAFKKQIEWENVRKGRRDALHLLAGPDDPGNNLDSQVADFAHIVSLPVDYLANHAESLGQRWRLKSPFLEHFSQAFARFFMRVGLPSSIAPFGR